MHFLLSLLLSMTLAGSIPFVICLILFKFKSDSFSASFQYLCLKICIAFYLIPFPLIKHLLTSVFFPSYATAKLPEDSEELLLKLDGQILYLSDGVLINFSRFDKIFILICLAAAAFIIFNYIKNFRHFKFNIQRSVLSQNTTTPEVFTTLKKEMHIRRKITFCRDNRNIASFTYGLFHPVIILTDAVDETEAKMILCHELQHVKSLDFFFRILGFLTVLIHCFNPLAYVLLSKLKTLQELACDEKVLKNLTVEEKKDYGMMLIKMASAAPQFSTGILSYSSDKKKLLKKRIQKIGKHSGKHPFAASILMILLFLSAGVPVYAYQPDTLDFRNTENTTENLEHVNWILYSMEEDQLLFEDENEILFKDIDSYIVMDDGQIITDLQTSSSVRGCSHNYKPGTQKFHTIQGENCTVTAYSIKRCTKCGYVQILSQLSKFNYTPCPHSGTFTLTP